MTSERQQMANRRNAQLSTGPKSSQGKAIASINAIQHGIFTKTLLVSSDVSKENREDYEKMLADLIDCLHPANQIESLLVEKVAVDFWRLRRTIQFETGSIQHHLSALCKQVIACELQTEEQIDGMIREKMEQIGWNTTYLTYLEKGEVSFAKPIWDSEDIESDIAEDLYCMARSFENLTPEETESIGYEVYTFTELKALVKKYGYSSKAKITAKLIEVYIAENQTLELEIAKLHHQKTVNQEARALHSMVGLLPSDEHAEKVLKYERSLQKSIFQNLFLLKKLQGAGV